MRPPPGSMVWWRFRARGGGWHFGYCTYLNSPDLIRMGCWNGDTAGGHVVSAFEIEWKDYRP